MSDNPTAKVRLHNFKGDETAQTNLAKVLTMRELGGEAEVRQLARGESVTIEIPWPDMDVFRTAIQNYDLEIEEIRGSVKKN